MCQLLSAPPPRPDADSAEGQSVGCSAAGAAVGSPLFRPALDPPLTPWLSCVAGVSVAGVSVGSPGRRYCFKELSLKDIPFLSSTLNRRRTCFCFVLNEEFYQLFSVFSERFYDWFGD